MEEEKYLTEVAEEGSIVVVADSIDTSIDTKATARSRKVGEVKIPPHREKDLRKEMKKVRLLRQITTKIKIITIVKKEIMTNCHLPISVRMRRKISTKHITLCFQTLIVLQRIQKRWTTSSKRSTDHLVTECGKANIDNPYLTLIY